MIAEKGKAAKNLTISSAPASGTAPAFRHQAARVVLNGDIKKDRRPRGMVIKPTSGTTRKLAASPTREI